MPRTLLTGATGTLGTALRPALVEAGHDLRAASRSPPADPDGEWVELDLVDGTGIDDALDGVDVVVHAATAPRGDTEAVDVEGTKRLLRAGERAGATNVVYVSIVGVEAIPLPYYEHKLAAEAAIEDSDVPGTVLRATQFHGFLAELLGGVARLPVWPLPTKWQLQPVAAAEVAAAVAEYATPEAHGRVPPVCGPEVLSVGEIARAHRSVRGLRRPVVRLPVPGSTAKAFRAGEAARPDRSDGTVTWEEYLGKRYGEGTAAAASAASTA
jgi:uncharacterized protein YbjT (DUF2867 family)